MICQITETVNVGPRIITVYINMTLPFQEILVHKYKSFKKLYYSFQEFPERLTNSSICSISGLFIP